MAVDKAGNQPNAAAAAAAANNQPVAEAKAKKGKNAVEQPELRKLTAADILKLGGGEPQAPKQVRVRFAPSPTGHLHIGGARTALVNYLFAKANGGQFVLRIEDTDQMRSKPEYTEAILDGLRWLGMKWDEEPVFQSQRADLYAEKVEKLIADGKARRDPETGAVFFIMPKDGKLTINDRLKGRVEVEPEDDFVIQRADGSAAFLLANVVDDGDQGITHIFRGDDHLTNAAKQIELFRALGYDVPEMYHMPLIHGDPRPNEEDPTQKDLAGKLSKRHGATSVIDYQDQGFTPDVLMNHLARMGMGFDTDETLPIDDLAKKFDPTRLSKKESVLGLTSLGMQGKKGNKKYVSKPGPLLQRMFQKIMAMPTEELAAEIKSILGDADRVEKHITAEDTASRAGFFNRTGVTADEAREALSNLNDAQLEALADGGRKRFSTFMDALDFAAIVRAPLRYDEADAATLGGAKQKALMKKLSGELEKVPEKDWNIDKLIDVLDKFNDAQNVGYTAYGNSLRWMLTGNSIGFPLHNTMALLGREETLARLAEMTG